MNGSMRPELEPVDVDTLYLQPPAFKRKEKGKWQESGKSISFGLNPVNGEVASWVAHRVSSLCLVWWFADG
jgi:nuclear pore complex protein Nup85